MHKSHQNLKDKCKILAQDQTVAFDESVERMKRENAANGLLKSGNSIKFVMNLIEEKAVEFYDIAFSHIQALKFTFDPNLESDVGRIVKAELNNFVGPLYDRMAAVCALTGKPELHTRMKPDVELAVERAEKRFDNSLQHYVLDLENSQKVSVFAKGLGVIEVLILISIAFFGGMWANNPDGNYEPFIVLLTVALSGLEVWRRKIT
ncbi:hypothetical protein MIB92_19380 [Aestuariirhabdus sp. Z084]|uniref:hypothetical protein n=1 Tax=Aestuariirhabdus haliotis TaxID=2918751 RepID=UPI00201B3DEA|nr:hypothetical protein [Aestuariirhabdus haliotis]MCL6417820.1 hypothetical protein [Aestuariirhabdus haliotis]MCL6421739.1 hypothetical protein [Aestuariirhabdus haliotis]